MTTQPPDLEPTADEQTRPQPARAKIPPLRWRSPNPEDITPPSRPDEETAAGDDASPASPPMSDAPPEQPSTRSGSSRGSSRGSAEVRQAAKEAVAAAFDGGTAAVHQLLATDEVSRAVGLYLADEQDIEQVSEPASKIIGRHAGDIAGAANPDLADGIALGIALLGYLVKQIKRVLLARQLRAQGATVSGHQPNVEEPQP